MKDGWHYSYVQVENPTLSNFTLSFHCKHAHI